MSVDKELDNLQLQIKGLLAELHNLKKEFALKEEELQAAYLEIKNIKDCEEKHKKLNGELRKEIDDLKKQEKEMLLYP